MNWALELLMLGCADGLDYRAPGPARPRIGKPSALCLEGIDGSGKSTAAMAVVARIAAGGWPAVYVHGVRLHAAPEHWAAQWAAAALITAAAGRDGVILVWDRCWLSEPVYARVMGGREPPPDRMVERVGALWSSRAELRLVDTDPAEAARRLRGRGDDLDLIDHLPALASEYRRRGLEVYDGALG